MDALSYCSSSCVLDFSTKDHVSENVRRMRQIQRKCKQREQEAAKPVKVLWKSDRYADVESRIKQDLEVSRLLFTHLTVLLHWGSGLRTDMIVYVTCEALAEWMLTNELVSAETVAK